MLKIMDKKIFYNFMLKFLVYLNLCKRFAYLDQSYFGLQHEKTYLPGFANSKGVDQPPHPHSLIRAFVIRLLKSVISKLATNKISLF